MIVEIEKAHIECVEMAANNTYGKFVIEPLERALAIRWATHCVGC